VFEENSENGAFIFLQLIFSLAFSSVTIAATVRRFHDIGLSGKWLLLLLIMLSIPIFSGFFEGVSIAIFSAILVISILGGMTALFWKGNAGDNRFGPPPVWRNAIIP